MELRDYVTLVFRNWVAIAAATGVGLVAAFGLCIWTTPQYNATSKVVFTGHGGTDGRALAYAATFAQARMQTYRVLATTPTVLRPVIAKRGLEVTSTKLAKSVSVEASQIATVLTISVSDANAKNAAGLANDIAGTLINEVNRIENTNGPKPSITGEVAGPASVPKSASSPKTLIYLAIGGILGLLSSVAVLALREAVVRPAISGESKPTGSS